MTVLPIVERELRAASRRAGTYWSRILVAFLAVLLGASVFVVDFGATSADVGQFIFRCLAGLLLLFCLVQGRRASADCLSVEKREGTLGLLFLTDLRGIDVVLGKLVATSLGGLYGLMAVFPVLALTLLLGGVSNPEFWRMVLSLLNAFFFSLAVGVMTSSVSREHRRAMAANFLLFLGLAAAPPALAILLEFWRPAAPFLAPLCYPCPIFTAGLSFDVNYRGHAADFWWSLGLTHALSWILVGLAGWVVPRSWQDRPGRARGNRWRDFWRWISYGDRAKQIPYRRRLLSRNAFYWLAARARLKPVHVWLFLSGIGLWWLVGWLTSGPLWFDASVAIVMAWLMNTTLKIWLTIEAGQRLAEDHESGALELLLSTSISVRDLFRGQWLALGRQFLAPLAAVLALETIWLVCVPSYGVGVGPRALLTAGMVMLLADSLALGWVAMSMAMVRKNHNQATVAALGRILILPWLGFGGVMAVGSAWVRLTTDAPWEPGEWFPLFLWLGFGAAADFLFGVAAFRRLKLRLRLDAARRFEKKPGWLARWFRAPSAPPIFPAGDGPGVVVVPSQPRRRFRLPRWRWVAGTAVAAALALWWGLRDDTRYPPPVRHALTGTNTPISMAMVAGRTLVMVLPDGTLWRWGDSAAAGPPRPVVPERFGTNDHWAKVVAPAANRWLALRQDGSLWDGRWGGVSLGEPQPGAGDPGNWLDVTGSGPRLFGIRRDGSLWRWAPTPPPSAPSAPRPGQAGAGGGWRRGPSVPEPPPGWSVLDTNSDWVALASSGGATLGLRSNGTLWVWGPVWPVVAMPTWTTNVTAPTQACSDTNWTALDGVAWNRGREGWRFFSQPPNPLVPAVLVGSLLATNSGPGRMATAFGLGMVLYQVRDDGSLWRGPGPPNGLADPTVKEWGRVGSRRDWRGVWSSGGLCVGLTADGTVWTWGVDPTRTVVPDFRTRLQIARTRLGMMFGPRRGVGIGINPGQTTFVREPRPLMRLDWPAPGRSVTTP